MAGDLLEQLKAMDQAVVTEVVRKDQRDPDLVILDWTAEPLSKKSLGLNTGGLFGFSGRSQSVQGIQPWIVILKCINNQSLGNELPREWSYWRREILAFQSGLLERLPPGIRAPRCYGVIENKNGAWLWLEYIRDTTIRLWSLDTFQRAARQLGRFQAAYLSGTPLPDQVWLCEHFFRSLWADHEWVSELMKPESKENAWKSPVVQRGFDEQQMVRVLQLVSEKERFFDANDHLPQVLCHHDAQRRNFMWNSSAQTGEAELTAIDWALTGPGALGNDLGELIGTSLYFFDYDPYDVKTLEDACLEGYLSGITDAGLVIDPRLVRLGYLISLSFWKAALLPGLAALNMSSESEASANEMYGHTAEEVLAGWGWLEDFCLDRADEARSLIKQLGL